MQSDRTAIEAARMGIELDPLPPNLTGYLTATHEEDKTEPAPPAKESDHVE